MQRSHAPLRILIPFQFTLVGLMLIAVGASADDFWVDASTGDNGNPGTELLPFATITHAVSTGGAEANFYVLPGTYDEAHGETFPITLLTNQQLIGDPTTKGAGPEPTTIVGKGDYAGLSGIGSKVTVLCGPGSTISGFQIDADGYELRHAAVVIHGEIAEVSDNQMLGACYAGVYLSNAQASEIRGNVLESSSYGVVVSSCPDAPVIAENVFVSPSLSMDIVGSTSNPWIHNNVFQAGSRVGIQVQRGSPRIEGNTFEAGSGSVYGGIRAASAEALPFVRSNTFLNAFGVGIIDGNPDLGTNSNHGLNDFTGVTGVCIQHDGSADVSAVGNTWPNEPPLLGEDIIITGDGSVTVIAVPIPSTGFSWLKAAY